MRRSDRLRRLALSFAMIAPLCLSAGAFAKDPARAAQSEQARDLRSTRLSYSVSWHDTRVAGIRIQRGCPNTKSITSHALVASSTGLIDDIRSFSIRLDSFLRDSSPFPLRGHTTITEDDRTRSFRSKFSATSVEVDATIFGKKKPAMTRDLPERSHDLLSWVIALREALAENPEGAFESATYTVWDGWKFVEIKAERMHSESITTPHKTYEGAHVIELTRTRLDERGEKKKGDTEPLGTLWMSGGQDPALVAMDFASQAGVASIRLLDAKSTPCEGE